VVLKLKTADFHTLTRSLTPPARPTSASEVAGIACALRERVERPGSSRYRLVGVGLAGFVDRDSYQAQTDLFDTPTI
jgi:DNA polymerase-4